MSEEKRLKDTPGRNTTFVPISMIKVENRAREDKGDIEELAAKIQQVGLIQPITINQNHQLIAGERRLLAHIFLKKETIEAIIRPTKDKVDLAEVEIIENIARKDFTWQERCKAEKKLFDMKSAQGKWSQQKQADYLNQSQPSTFRAIYMAEALETIPDLAEKKDFADAWKDLKRLEEGAAIRILEDKVPGSVKTAAKWASDHYHVGDAFKGMAPLRNELVHFAEVDPPYAVDLDGRKDRNKRSNMDEYNEVDPDEYINFYERTASEVFRLLRPDCFAIFWFGWDWFSEVREIIIDAGFKIPTVPAIWTKGASGQTASPDTTLGSCHEPFWLARKGLPKLAKPGRGNVFDFSPVSPARKIHPTERPIEMMKEILATTCLPGSSILVPFLGSGVTLRAAYQLSHTGFGWDLSDENKKKFLRRVAEDKGEEDELLLSGEPLLASGDADQSVAV